MGECKHCGWPIRPSTRGDYWVHIRTAAEPCSGQLFSITKFATSKEEP